MKILEISKILSTFSWKFPKFSEIFKILRTFSRKFPKFSVVFWAEDFLRIKNIVKLLLNYAQTVYSSTYLRRQPPSF